MTHDGKRLVVLHSNDIHGRVDGVARIATMVAEARAADPNTPVLYVDAGDVEEPSQALSNLTKGAAMHRLLNAAGCDAAVAGNGAWLRYGPQVLAEHGTVARHPLLLANLRKLNGDLLDGVQPTALLNLGDFRLGLIGLSVDMPEYTAFFDISALPALPLVRDLADALRCDGANGVIVLSHMGLAADRELAGNLAGQVLAIVGGHSHDLLPSGELVGGVLVAQAGQYAEHLGRLGLEWNGGQLRLVGASVIPVSEETPAMPAVTAEAQAIEEEGRRFLDEIIGELAGPLDFAADRECGVADLMADVLRERMGGEVAVVAAGQAFSGPLAGGPLSRGTLWHVCSSTANPALVAMTGAQLVALVQKGLDPAFAAERPHTLRGQPRGLIHLSGASVRRGELLVDGSLVEAARSYQVAGTDWEFEPYGGYADRGWELHPCYDVPTILREALEDYLAVHRPVHVALGRLA